MSVDDSKDGCLQQIGAPLVLHDHPANRFVATFMGSPTMNMITVEVEQGKLKNSYMTLPVSLQQTVLEAQQRVVLGIRPHQIQICSSTQAHAHLQVEALEPLGSETLIHGTLIDSHINPQANVISQATARFSVKLAGDHHTLSHSQVQLGDRLPMMLPPQALHLFEDDDAGRRIECMLI
jgi:sn-glycerol 3-phosphate transport system ATP-binding protein